MAGLLDDYQIPADLPPMNLGVDPEMLRRARALAMIQGGLGLASNPRNPAAALAAGINTYTSGEEQARAEARLNMELALKQHQAQAQQLQDLRRAALIKSVPDEQLRAYGVPDALIQGFKAAEKPEQYLAALEQLKSYTLGPNQARFNAAGGMQTQMPGSQGQVVGWDQGAGQPSSFTLLPGAAQTAAALAGSTRGAEQANTIQTLPGPGGPVSGYGANLVGPPPSAARPYQTNFTGTPQQQAALQAAAAQDFARTGGVVQGQNPVDVQNASKTYDQLLTDYANYREAPNGLMQLYRAQDAIKSGAFTGPMAGWKASSIATLNSVLPDSWQMNVGEVTGTKELQKAMGAQILQHARAFGANPTAAEERRLDNIIGSSNDPKEAIQQALPFAEAMIRREVGIHNTRVADYSSAGYRAPTNIAVTLPTRQEYEAQLRSATTATPGTPTATAPAAVPTRVIRYDRNGKRIE